MLIRTNRTFVPPTDVVELTDRLVVIVEIAGMEPNGFNITLHNRRLSISGTRTRPELAQPAYHQVEIGFGEFKVEVTLPWSVNRDEVSAAYQHGFLQIELPRKPAETVPVVERNTKEQE